MDSLKEFYGPNAGFILELYDKFLHDHTSVDSQTRIFFENHPPHIEDDISLGKAGQDLDSWKTVLAVTRFAQNIRQFGHLAAQLDPLGISRSGDGTLRKEYYGLDDETLQCLPSDLVGGPIAARTKYAFEAIEMLTKIYTSTIGFDFEHVHATEERTWFRESIEGRLFAPPQMQINERALLEQLTQIEVFEQFLQRTFPGKFRFSIEGVDMLVPMLLEQVSLAKDSNIKSVIIGMAHRGRLNVLAHVLQVPYSAIFAEFKDPARHRNSRADLDWTGDVKYHRGAFRIQKSPQEMEIFLAPNPSHLEAIDPVVEGMARAAGTDSSKGGVPSFNPEETLPILIHGDASFPGQGIVAETLNLSRLDGYSTGGTIHIITNNQLGYTATPDETRSTRYSSDLAKGFEIPIIHVNADDPDACIESIRIASAYREKFHKDFLVDLVGYRRYGHNESDEPTFTQPLMYERIKNVPTVRKKWADVLAQRGTIRIEDADQLVKKGFEKLQSALSSLEPDKALIEPRPAVPPSGAARMTRTQINLNRLQKLNEALLSFPANFSVHQKLERIIEKRRRVLDNPDVPSVDWATAELLSMASILEDGIPIRLTGQDSDRGTFSHRHVTFHDVKNGKKFSPLRSFNLAKASFEIYNSPLTEEASIGFEYGYNVQEPGRLVIWEAQYGDFINNAQTMVDEFITSARAKWGQTPSLVLLLPHAYEGQGPDHSSGRLERFLSLAAELNIRIANCTTAAQYFHLLRRQALLLKIDPLPLVVMTPKGLLRHPRTASTPKELFAGKWHPIIDDPKPLHESARRLIFCSGKIFVDLIDSKYRQQNEETAIIRIEQLYPFPESELKDIAKNYSNINEVIWAQEGPQNMGVWSYISPLLKDLFGNKIPVKFVGRAANASPSEGSTALHLLHQSEIIEKAFSGKTSTKHTIEAQNFVKTEDFASLSKS